MLAYYTGVIAIIWHQSVMDVLAFPALFLFSFYLLLHNLVTVYDIVAWPENNA